MKNNIISLQVIWALNVGRSGVRRDALVKRFTEEGLRVPRAPNPSALLTRAVERTRAGRQWLHAKRMRTGVGFISHQIDDSGKKINPRHFVTATASYDFNGRPDITIDEVIDVAELSDNELEFIRALLEAYKESAEFANATDMRSILQRAVRGGTRSVGMGGVPVVGNGVQAYWVPATFAKELTALRAIVEELSPNSRVDVFSMTNEGGNLESVRRHVKDQHMQELADLRAEVKDLVSNRDLVGVKTIDAKLEAFRKLDGAVMLWKDVLGDIAEELAAGIETAKRQLQGELGLDVETSDGPVISGSARLLHALMETRYKADTMDLTKAVELLTRAGNALSPQRVRQLILELVSTGLIQRVSRGNYALA